MSSGKTGSHEKLRDVAIIAVGLLLSFAVLMCLCTIAIGGPLALFGLIVGMMGPSH